MRSKQLSPRTKWRPLLWLTTTAALPLLLSCATVVKDFPQCFEIPPPIGGAACDNFLTSNPQTLTELQWEALKASWNASGNAVVCTTSGAIGSLKVEIEQLCSRTKCSYQTAAAAKIVAAALGRLQMKAEAALQ
jgi:hypothetical protein